MNIGPNATIEEKRKLLDSFGGKFFSVEFIKADKSLRKANCKRFIHAAFTDGHASLAKGNPASHKPELFTACDVDKEEGWININLNTLKKVVCGGKEYNFKVEVKK